MILSAFYFINEDNKDDTNQQQEKKEENKEKKILYKIPMMEYIFSNLLDNCFFPYFF